MPKSQIVTNRNKKASSATTPKASHLTLIPPVNRNIAMNNSTANCINNQIRSKEECQRAALLIIYKADQLSQSANNKSWAIQSIGKTINQNIINNMPIDDNMLSGLLHAIEVLTTDLINESSALESLIDAGEYSDE